MASARQRYSTSSSTSANFLARIAIYTRDHASEQPTRETHFYHRGECAILNEGGQACFAIVVGLVHKGAPSMGVDRSDDLTALSRRLPHSIFFGAFHALAIDDAGGGTGFPFGFFPAFDVQSIMDARQYAVVVPK